MNIKEIIKIAEDLADSMQDADVGIPNVEFPNTYDAVWAVRDLVEYVRRAETFHELAALCSDGNDELDYVDYTLVFSRYFNKHQITYDEYDTWMYEETKHDGTVLRMTYSHNEIVKEFERRRHAGTPF